MERRTVLGLRYLLRMASNQCENGNGEEKENSTEHDREKLRVLAEIRRCAVVLGPTFSLLEQDEVVRQMTPLPWLEIALSAAQDICTLLEPVVLEFVDLSSRMPEEQ